MFNPFGEDDDDYEMNMFIDQYMKVSLLFCKLLKRAQITLLG